MSVTIQVRGQLPLPQGSKRNVTHKVTGRTVMLDDSPYLKLWRGTVTTAARPHAGTFVYHEPVMVVLDFIVARPKSVKRDHPAVRPDIDKLSRAILDALSDARVWVDDGQAVVLHAAKRYPAGDEQVGVEIRLDSMEVKW